MPSAIESLYRLMDRWDKSQVADIANQYQWHLTLDEILLHASLRYSEYRQFRDTDGDFAERFLRWLNNVQETAQQQALFRLARHVIFLDTRQMESLYRDCFRRVITSWVIPLTFRAKDYLASDFEQQVISLLRSHLILSVTESYSFSAFLAVNSLAGLPKPRILGEDGHGCRDAARAIQNTTRGVIVLEDFVGTGNQAGRVLVRLGKLIPSAMRMLFCPLIILERGLQNLADASGMKGRVDIVPTYVVSGKHCITEEPAHEEDPDFGIIRPLLQSTGTKVCRRLDENDDPPNNPFGYKGSGALLITVHNAPNNTLPAIHHRAPLWHALFRRVHHCKDGLR